MSTYPEKDLHSVYLDGELPDDFVEKYETLVKSSEKSSAELKKMQKIHELLKEDSEKKDKEITQEFIDASFDRLMTKMKYSKVIQQSTEKSPFAFSNIARWTVPFAAAAVFAVIVAPTFMTARSGLSPLNGELKTISLANANTGNITPLAENNVIIDGDIRSDALASVFGAVNDYSEDQLDVPATVITSQKTVPATSLASSSLASKSLRNNLRSVDVFIPDSMRGSTRRFSVPKFHELPDEINGYNQYNGYNEYIGEIPNFSAPNISEN